MHDGERVGDLPARALVSQRLCSAVRDGLLEWPAGRILLNRVPAEFAPQLPLDQCAVVHGFAPEIANWTAQGVTVAEQIAESYAASLTALPRVRDHGRVLVAQAIRATVAGGLVLIDGQKTDGIEPLLKALRPHLACEIVSKAHGKLLIARRPDSVPAAIAAWLELKPAAPRGWHTALGGFSASAIDTGSAILAAHLPPLSGKVVDLGAGWGFLSKAILAQPKVTSLALVEAEHAMLEAAQLNITDPRATFFWSDARTFGPRFGFDAVVMNPPFHTGRAADPDLGRAFILAAVRLLRPKGQLVLVANRHLPYETELAGAFAQVDSLVQDAGFKVIHARDPKRII